MNPYLKAKRDLYAGLVQTAQDVQTRAVDEKRDLTEAELTQVTGMAAEAEKMFAEIETLQALETRNKALTDMAGSLHGGAGSDGGQGGGDFQRVAGGGTMGGGVDPERTPFRLMWTPEQMRRMDEAFRESGTRVSMQFRHDRMAPEHVRAALGLAASGGPIEGGYGFDVEPRRLITTVGLNPMLTESRGTSGPLFGLPTGSAPTAEGGTKPEGTAHTALAVVPAALAVWHDEYRHAILSQSNFTPQLAAHQAHYLAMSEDLMIVTAVDVQATAAGAISVGAGGSATAVQLRDGVHQAIAEIVATTAVQPDVVICHPDNFASLAQFAPNDAPSVAGLPARFAGCALYPTEQGTTADEILVCALAAGGAAVTTGAPVTSMDEALKTNLVTVRTEEVFGFGLRLAGVSRLVDIAA